MPAVSRIETLWHQRRLACAGWPAVSEHRMFGCHTVFAADKIFALVWPEGRLGVRLPEPALHAALLGQTGAAPWRVKGKTMSAWVLMPETFHDDPARLGEWVAHAHRLALTAAPPPARRPRGAQRRS